MRQNLIFIVIYTLMIYEIKIIIISFERIFLNLTLYDIMDETELNILLNQHNCPIYPKEKEVKNQREMSINTYSSVLSN